MTKWTVVNIWWGTSEPKTRWWTRYSVWCIQVIQLRNTKEEAWTILNPVDVLSVLDSISVTVTVENYIPEWNASLKGQCTTFSSSKGHIDKPLHLQSHSHDEEENEGLAATHTSFLNKNCTLHLSLNVTVEAKTARKSARSASLSWLRGSHLTGCWVSLLTSCMRVKCQSLELYSFNRFKTCAVFQWTRWTLFFNMKNGFIWIILFYLFIFRPNGKWIEQILFHNQKKLELQNDIWYVQTLKGSILSIL